jgi:hypothetical protein
VLAQLVEDLLHLERRGQRLDEHRGADGAPRDANELLGADEDIVPESGLEVVTVEKFCNSTNIHESTK